MILQLIDKAGDFVSDDIWFRVVQFVTNNEDLQVISAFIVLMISVVFLLYLSEFYAFVQPYAAVKAREYLDKPAIHETMVKVCIFCSSFAVYDILLTGIFIFLYTLG